MEEEQNSSYYEGRRLHLPFEYSNMDVVSLGKLILFFTEVDEELQMFIFQSHNQKMIACRNLGTTSGSSIFATARSLRGDYIAVSYNFDTYVLSTKNGFKPPEQIYTDGRVEALVFNNESSELLIAVMASLVVCTRDKGEDYSEDRIVEIGDEAEEIITSLAFSSNNRLLAIGLIQNQWRKGDSNHDSRVVLWDSKLEQQICSFEAKNRLFVQISFLVHIDSILCIWDNSEDQISLAGLTLLHKNEDDNKTTLKVEDITHESLGNSDFIQSEENLWILTQNIMTRSYFLSRVEKLTTRSADKVYSLPYEVSAISDKLGYFVTKQRKGPYCFLMPTSYLHAQRLAITKSVELSDVTNYELKA